MNTVCLAVLALCVDAIVGDPRKVPHPVIYIGKWIAFLDAKWNDPHLSHKQARARGIVLTFLTVTGAFAIPWGVLYGIRHVYPPLAVLLNIWLISTTVAWKGLVDAGKNVQRALSEHGLEAGRQAVSMIVGRDTQAMTEADVLRATIETLAENIVDSTVAPILFACLGGAPLAMCYRAANTLDSMVGYKNARYQYFGWASARLDDVLNYVPARLTALLMGIALIIQRLGAVRAWKVMVRDARKHPSPNSGIPESLMAGALGVTLGGQNHYGGVTSWRPQMGERTRDFRLTDIEKTISVVNGTTLCLLFVLVIAAVVLWRYGMIVRL